VSAPRAIGVDCGGTKILAGVVGRDGTVDRRHTVPTPTSSEDDLLEALERVVETLLSEDVAAIGMGVPSQIDQRTGRAVSSVHVPLSDVDLRDRMRDRFGLPVGIDNDGNAAAIAEWQLGAGRGASNVVVLTLGTGIGGGLILDPAVLVHEARSSATWSRLRPAARATARVRSLKAPPASCQRACPGASASTPTPGG
jgi:glucokinase